MSISAMKQALEALESIKVTVSTSIEANVVDGIDLFPKEIVALRQAIAEAEKQEPDVDIYDVWVEQEIKEKNVPQP